METLKLSAVGQSAGGIEILQALRAGSVGDPAAHRSHQRSADVHGSQQRHSDAYVFRACSRTINSVSPGGTLTVANGPCPREDDLGVRDSVRVCSGEPRTDRREHTGYGERRHPWAAGQEEQLIALRCRQRTASGNSVTNRRAVDIPGSGGKEPPHDRPRLSANVFRVAAAASCDA